MRAKEIAQHISGVRPERAHALLAAFAEQMRRRRSTQDEVANSDTSGLGGSCSGVVEEKEKCVVAATLSSLAVWYGQQRVDLVLIEVRYDSRRRAAWRDGLDVRGLLNELGTCRPMKRKSEWMAAKRWLRVVTELPRSCSM
jgi:hypothetical protein